MSTLVVSYAVMPSGEQETVLRFWKPRSKYSDGLTPNDYDTSQMDDEIEQPLSKRTNLKRLVILSARGFGKK
ncbi:hypothetical protein L3Y34_009041 [Caenorhabditis briggsae]|nr:hypothetical protein L3Y34_009041 [Caenorhabditis briggsae]